MDDKLFEKDHLKNLRETRKRMRGVVCQHQGRKTTIMNTTSMVVEICMDCGRSPNENEWGPNAKV